MQGFCLKNLILQSLKHLLGVDPLHRHNSAQADSSFAMEGMPQNLRKTRVWVKPISWDRSSLANSGALSRTISDPESGVVFSLISAQQMDLSAGCLTRVSAGLS